jgi:transcriptional regulator with XRE-family HTH domain
MEIYDKPSEWGETVAQLRKDTGITQLELSQRSGVSQCHISYIENNKRAATLQVAELLFNSMNHRLELICNH